MAEGIRYFFNKCYYIHQNNILKSQTVLGNGSALQQYVLCGHIDLNAPPSGYMIYNIYVSRQYLAVCMYLDISAIQFFVCETIRNRFDHNICILVGIYPKPPFYCSRSSPTRSIDNCNSIKCTEHTRSGRLTSAVDRATRFVPPPEIGVFNGRTVFTTVEVNPRVIITIRHAVFVAVLRSEKKIIKKTTTHRR